MNLLTIGTLKLDLDYIINKYEKDTDIISYKDAVDFSDAIQNYDDKEITNDGVDSIIYLNIKNQDITKAFLKEFFNRGFE